MLYRALCMSVGFSFVGRGFRFSRNVAFESSGLLGVVLEFRGREVFHAGPTSCIYKLQGS